MHEDNDFDSSYNLENLAGMRNCYGDLCVRNFLSGYDPRVSFSNQLEDAQYYIDPVQWTIGKDKKTCPINPGLVNRNNSGNFITRALNALRR